MQRGVGARGEVWRSAYGLGVFKRVRVDAVCRWRRCVSSYHGLVRWPGRVLTRVAKGASRSVREVKNEAWVAGEVLWARCGDEGLGRLERRDLEQVMRELRVGRLVALCGWSIKVRAVLREREEASKARGDAGQGEEG